MGMYQFVYTFPIDQFQTEIGPIIAHLENGFVQPLYDRAAPIYKKALQLDRENRLPTILDDHGLYLWGREIPPSDLLDQEDLRILLMVLLADYLSFSEGSLGDHWLLLEITLTRMGWNREDTELLVYGLPMPYLLRPKHFPAGKTFLSLVETGQYGKEHPRWQWLGGAMDGGAGWVNREMVQNFWDKVVTTKSTIMKATEQILDAIFKETISKAPHHYARLYQDMETSQSKKEFLLDLLRKRQAALASAKKREEGLFLAISG